MIVGLLLVGLFFAAMIIVVLRVDMRATRSQGHVAHGCGLPNAHRGTTDVAPDRDH